MPANAPGSTPIRMPVHLRPEAQDRSEVTMSTHILYCAMPPESLGSSPDFRLATAFLASSAGVLRRVITRIFECRSQSMDRMATVYLQALSDRQVYDLGFSASEIASLRSGRIRVSRAFLRQGSVRAKFWMIHSWGHRDRFGLNKQIGHGHRDSSTKLSLDCDPQHKFSIVAPVTIAVPIHGIPESGIAPRNHWAVGEP